jgi:hypothetical protein
MAEVVAVAGLWLATVLGLRGVWDDQCVRPTVLAASSSFSPVAPPVGWPLATPGR